MLVNATEMLIKARDGHYGVPQFNINNLEWTKAVLTACEEMKSPVILGVSEGAGKYMTGFKTVAAMVDAMVDSMGITVPVALHLDHGTYEGCKACVEAGFSSIMFDGSQPLLHRGECGEDQGAGRSGTLQGHEHRGRGRLHRRRRGRRRG